MRSVESGDPGGEALGCGGTVWGHRGKEGRERDLAALAKWMPVWAAQNEEEKKPCVPSQYGSSRKRKAGSASALFIFSRDSPCLPGAVAQSLHERIRGEGGRRAHPLMSGWHWLRVFRIPVVYF